MVANTEREVAQRRSEELTRRAEVQRIEVEELRSRLEEERRSKTEAQAQVEGLELGAADYSLRSLLNNDPALEPPLMATDAWQRREISTALASYEGPASLEVDHIDPETHQGWSVLGAWACRGDQRRGGAPGGAGRHPDV